MSELEKKYIYLKNSFFCKTGKLYPYVVLFLQTVVCCSILVQIFIQISTHLHASEQKSTLYKVSKLSIVTSSVRHNFLVEVAKSASQRQRGLMGRQKLLLDRGMLFDFVLPQKINMWMKHTHIPLDMLFIDEFGKIITIVSNTVPNSETIISSPHPARAVLELNAGTISRLKIKVGDKIIHQIFQPENYNNLFEKD